MMSVKSALWKYLDDLPQCEISSWQLYDAMYAITGRHTLPSTLLSYARTYCDIAGADFTCIDNQRSIYKYTPGYKISGAITGGKEMSEKWTKEQIEEARKYFNESCNGISCSNCHLLVRKGKRLGCLIQEKLGKAPSSTAELPMFRKEFENLIQQHKHDVDELFCKQTTLPHTGTTRVLDYVLADLKSRAEMGKQKYGQYLETNNGRNALQDAYEEALDMCMYLKQKLLEEKGK